MKIKEELVEGLICYDSKLTIKEVKQEWERIGLGQFTPLSRLTGLLLFNALQKDIVLCEKKIRDGETKLFTSVGLNRKYKLA